MKTQNTKPRADSKLKNLPLGRQAEIAEMLRTRTLQTVREILKAEGLKTSSQSLSQFFAFYQRKQMALGTDINALSFEIRRLNQRLNRRDYETARLASQARAAIALLKRSHEITSVDIDATLKKIFRIK